MGNIQCSFIILSNKCFPLRNSRPDQHGPELPDLLKQSATTALYLSYPFTLIKGRAQNHTLSK
jgi:hypothetical protein